ncbi:MAG TPA: glycosyltransferase family 1 protein [Actinomycetota bacterium]|nr:glycosyltransferase family 1 protein [Actinomycetota bacterium]
MRVAYDAAPLLNPLTGVGHYAAELYRELSAVDGGPQLRLFAVGRQRSAPPELTVRRVMVPARAAVAGWEVARFPPGEWLVGRADAVHGTNFWVPPLQRANGVVTIHDLTFLLHPEWCTPAVRRYRWIVPKVLGRSAVVVTPSETIAEQVTAELSFPRERIVVTPEGVREAVVPAGAAPAAGGDYALFVGAREPRKNLGRLLAAFKGLGDLGLDLVIAGPAGWGESDLHEGVNTLAGGVRVTVTGYLTDAALAATLRSAQVFVFPSLYEGFGLPPLEAMAAGVPVVAARAGSLPEVLGDAPFWCDPLDASSIGEAIRRSVTDGEARAVAIERGRARAAGYRWSETARLTIEAYRRAATG